MRTTSWYYYWLQRLEFQLMDPDTLNYGGLGLHPRGAGGGGGGPHIGHEWKGYGREAMNHPSSPKRRSSLLLQDCCCTLNLLRAGPPLWLLLHPFKILGIPDV